MKNKVKKDKRFIKTHSQSMGFSIMEIYVDRETGINYVCNTSGFSGGLTVLLDSDGKPVVTPICPED